MISPYPTFQKAFVDQANAREVHAVQEVVSYIRNIRGEHQISPSKKIPVTVVTSRRKLSDLMLEKKDSIEKMAGISELKVVSKTIADKGMVTGTTAAFNIFIPMSELFEPEEERRRLQKELSRVTLELTDVQKKLSVPSFIKNAPADVVDGEKERLRGLEERVQKIKEGLKRIGEGSS